MKEYIERKKAKQILVDDYAYSAANLLDTVPTADVQEVKHGKWLNFYGDYTTAGCSLCGKCFEVTFDEEVNGALFEGFKLFYKYCPHCGAKMDRG